MSTWDESTAPPSPPAPIAPAPPNPAPPSPAPPNPAAPSSAPGRSVEPGSPAKKGRSVWFWVFAVLCFVLMVPLLLAIIARLFFVQAYFIPSGAMQPTLDIRDRVLVEKINATDADRGEIIVFKKPEGTEGAVNDLIKRVVALPTETIVFQNGDVYIDGALLEESYLADLDSTFPLAGIPGCLPPGSATECTVPPDHVFVLGDNRRGSTDSRVFGPVAADSIVGRAWLRIYPEVESL